VGAVQVEPEASLVGPQQNKKAASMVIHPCVLRIAMSRACVNRKRRSIRMSLVRIVAIMGKGVSDEYLQNFHVL
jgi:hypothetical protein